MSGSVFLLVHGGWHGGWCWRRVADRLRALGHRVFTPALTGMGEREHLFTPEVGLHTHVQDVLAVVDHAIEIGVADPQRLAVGGRSYGGTNPGGTAFRPSGNRPCNAVRKP